METQRLSLDKISTLPSNIIENILTFMPIRDALRTSILSTKWRYSWRGMPKLVFTNDMVKVPSHRRYAQSKNYKLVRAIFHVLLFHNGPTILECDISVGEFQMVSELDQIIGYLSKVNNVKDLKIVIRDGYYKLPVSFFSLQGLVHIYLFNCVLEPPLAFEGFSQLKSVSIFYVKISAQMLQWFLSKCVLLDHICLGLLDDEGFAAEVTNFTYADLSRCVPLIETLDVKHSYAKYMCAGGIPHRLPTSLVHLKYLYLEVCLMEQNEISSVLCMIRSSPVLEEIVIGMYDNEKVPVQQTPTNFLDPEEYSDMNLDHLVELEIERFRNLPLEVEFVKLIMAKSPVLEKVLITLNDDVSIDEELNMYRGLVRLSFPRASPSANLIIQRPKSLDEDC